MYDTPRKRFNGRYTLTAPTTITGGMQEGIAVEAIDKDGKVYGSYRTINLAKAYTGVTHHWITKSVAENIYVKTNKGELKFKVKK